MPAARPHGVKGSSAQVGANTVVLDDVTAETAVVGVPAKQLLSRRAD